MEKKFFLYFSVATCWKLSTMFISSQIDSTAKIGHPECIKHDLELVYENKNVFSVFQCCNFLKTVQNVNFISNKQHSKNWTPRVHQTWFRACFWKKKKLYFNVATFWKLSKILISSQINSTAKIGHPRVHQTWFRACFWKKKLVMYVATCWKLSTVFLWSSLNSTAKM